jgi:hypothetical protein
MQAVLPILKLRKHNGKEIDMCSLHLKLGVDATIGCTRYIWLVRALVD